MIIVEDKAMKYFEPLRSILRDYNYKHLGDKVESSEYFYAVKDDHLLGAIHTKFFWDWIGIGNCYFENVETLSNLIGSIANYYGHKAVGIKYYTDNASQVEAFRSLGFEVGGTSQSSPKSPVYYYLYHKAVPSMCCPKVDILQSSSPIIKYQVSETEESDDKELLFAALDNDRFVGGLYVTYTEDSMYISRIAVEEAYRKHGIGKQLMATAEQKARSLGLYSITLGTLDFQAKAFYELLGFEVVFTKYDDPKGHESYSMIKVL